MSSWQPTAQPIPVRSRVASIFEAFPIAGFSLTLASDIAYWQTENLMWQNFSSWLLACGLAGGVLAGLWWLLGLMLGWWRANWPAAALGLAILIVAFINSLVHAGDGWTAVVPWGLALSGLTVGLMLASALLGRRSRY